MAFSIVADHDQRLVRIKHWDELVREEMFLARSQAGAILKELGYLRLLVDVRHIHEAPDTIDTFEVSTSHADALPPKFRLAILVSTELIADALFGENVSTNRGFNSKVFLDEPDALAWLCQ